MRAERGEALGSRYLKAPFAGGGELERQRVEATERIMEIQFQGVEKQLVRIEQLVERLERRLWVTVYGVLGAILLQAARSALELAAGAGLGGVGGP